MKAITDLARLFLTATLLAICHPIRMSAAPPDKGATGTCPLVWIDVERLPSLNTPRVGHSTLYINDELMVVGGHTNGFVPTATAEYLKDGQWHTLATTYTHDFGFALPLRSGQVLIGGGAEQPLGIGQTHTIEMYDPATRQFDAFACLDIKRMFPDALQMGGDTVLIAGNWYHADGFELFNGNRSFSQDGEVSFSTVRPFSRTYSMPHIMRTADNEAIVFSSSDIHGEPFDTFFIEPLHGEPYTEPLFRTWHPLYSYFWMHRTAEAFIGDESAHHYAYLFAVEDSSHQVAFARMDNGTFSLIPTVCPVPMQTMLGPITYYGAAIADRERGIGYLVGFDTDRRFYALSIRYDVEGPAPLCLYYTDPLPDAGIDQAVLTPDGDLCIIGGVGESNFTPCATAFRLHVRTPQALTATSHPRLWLIVLLLVSAAALVIFLLLRRAHRKGAAVPTLEAKTEGESASTPQPATNEESELHRAQLMQRLCALMDEEKPYLQKDLKIGDVARMLGKSSRYIADCIHANKGCSFAHFINTYRTNYAIHLLRTEPTKKIVSVCYESGFPSESTFFRTFRLITGKSPLELQQELLHEET